MYRTAIESLYKWKADKNKKPLIIGGARQTGKTWLMKTFGAEAYDNTVYINFDNNPPIRDLFSSDFNIERIILGLELYVGHKISPTDTLLIFDEVQEVPLALSSLKYFNENAPQYQIICAGSLLGITLHKGTSFPVGKVSFMELYPLSFSEFMLAMGKEQFVELLKKDDFQMATTFKQEYIDLLKHYYYVGGMPEVVDYFVKNKDFNGVAELQQRILDSYEQDFSKHTPKDIMPRVRMLWDSLPSQLAKESKKFIYGLIKEGARAKEYELAMLWLTDYGLIYKVHRVTKPSVPLKAYRDLKAFKLFLLDIGLLSRMAGLRQETLINGNALFTEFKGALTEQYVMQQLKTIKGLEIGYWTNDSGSAEVDFIIENNNNNIIPIEVKAQVNLQAKSLKSYYEKYLPTISIRTSMADYKKEDWLLNLPLWAIERVADI